MLNHPISDEQLLSFASYELDAATAARVVAHLAECATCARTVAHYEAIRAVYREGDLVAPPSPTLARAQAIYALNRTEPAVDWRRRLFGWLDTPQNLVSTPVLTTLLVVVVLFFAGIDLLMPSIQSTIPGDTFYPVKTTLEDVQLAVSTDKTAQVQLELSIANARVQELDALVAQGRYQQVPDAARDLEHHIQGVATTLTTTSTQDPSTQVELARRAQDDLSRYAKALTSLAESSPNPVKPEIQRAASLTDAAQTTVQRSLADPKPAPVPSTAAPLPTSNAASPAPTTTPVLAVTQTPLPAATNTPLPPASSEPTGTPVPAFTNTPILPTVPAIVPAQTPVPVVPAVATNTPFVPTNTPVIPTETPAPVATTAPAIPTATSEPLPTIQLLPISPAGPTSTPVPPTAAPATSVPPTPVPPTPVPPTAAPAPTNTPVPPPATVAPAATATSKPAPTKHPSQTPAPAQTATPSAKATSTPKARTELDFGTWQNASAMDTSGVFFDLLSNPTN